ncbi:hypothetical protein J437_LFUL009752, partial [Ladona fulva]
MQELLLGGNLYLQVLKERMQSSLSLTKRLLIKQFNSKSGTIITKADVEKAVKRSGGIDHAMETFISTGNVVSQTGLGLMQLRGLTIMAENINRLRYMSHFRSVHRGSFFVEMRSTESRKLLPDSWGFLCPVHTPDGSPCGLLNHLAKKCFVVTKPPSPWILKNLPDLLIGLGMFPLGYDSYPNVPLIDVMLDGKVIGFIQEDQAKSIEKQLRMLKIEGLKVPKMTEIVLVERKPRGLYPGLYLFTSIARMMRPVFNIAAQAVEMIGTFEQVFLEVCVSASEAYKGITTHQEISKTDFMSNLACLIPLPDYNQSPRNMYQCQ